MGEVSPKQSARSELAEALRRCRHAFIGIGVFSGLILMLTAPIGLASHSVPPLIGLAILAARLFDFQ